MEYHVESLLRGNMFMDLFESRCAGIMGKYNLRRVDTEVISYLYNNQDKNTAGDIGRFLNRNKGYISQVVDRLCQEDTLQRCRIGKTGVTSIILSARNQRKWQRM